MNEQRLIDACVCGEDRERGDQRRDGHQGHVRLLLDARSHLRRGGDGISRYCGNFSAGVSDSDKCDAAMSEADEALQDIDIYNIYAPNCQSAGLVTPPVTASVRTCLD